MTRQITHLLSILIVLASCTSGCAPVATTVQPAPLTPTTPVATPTAPPQSFEAGGFLFVEVTQQRVQKSTTGRQTTSFAGEQSSYNYNPTGKTLRGPLEGTPTTEMPVIIGHLVITQIDRASATAGQLYALSQSGQSFGAIFIEHAQADGHIVFTCAGQTYVLKPGEHVEIDISTAPDPDGEPLPGPSVQQTMVIVNHGFLSGDSLIIDHE